MFLLKGYRQSAVALIGVKSPRKLSCSIRSIIVASYPVLDLIRSTDLGLSLVLNSDLSSGLWAPNFETQGVAYR